MGFTPSDKPTMKKCKKGLWSPDEDQKLRNYVINYGHGCWSSVPINAGLQRSGKSCRLRWINYLRPGLKRGAFSAEEEDTIFTLHQILGNKWSQMAHHLPGRTDNEIKNHWHSHLKKRISKTVETQVNEYTNKTVEGSEVSYSSPATTDESIILQTEQSVANQNCNLPKVLFAEWLSLDQFHDANTSSAGSATSAVSKYSVEESEDSLVQDLFFDEGVFAGQVLHPAQQSNGIIPMDNDMFQSSFVDHASMIDYNFPSEFNVDCHYMYM